MQQPDLPSAESSGWIYDSSGSLNIKWYSGSFLPVELEDIIPEDINNEEYDQEIDYDDSREDSDTDDSDSSYSDSDTDDEI